MKRHAALRVIDVDDLDEGRAVDSAGAWNTDGIENAHFIRLRPIDCSDGARPCPWLSCRYHNGEWSPETCALDVADGGPRSLREIGRIMGISNEAVLDTERRALRKLLALRDEVIADDDVDREFALAAEGH